MCTATRTSSYSPVGPSVFFCVCIFSLGLCFACSFLPFDLFVFQFLCFLGQLSHLPYSSWC